MGGATMKFTQNMVIIVWIHFIRAQEKYHRSCNTKSCANVSHQCSLAVPISNATDMSVPGVENELEGTESLWVGYVKAHVAFQYKGCAKINNPRDDIICLKTKQDVIGPGRCRLFCNTSIVGISYDRTQTEFTCFDMAKYKGTVLKKKCNASCQYPNNTLCGGLKGGNVFISVYEEVTYPSTKERNDVVLSDTKLCLAYASTDDPFFFWNSCSESYKVLCATDDSIEIVHEYGQWDKQMMKCLDLGYKPVKPELSTLLSRGNQSDFWIGVIRAFSIFNYSGLVCNKSKDRSVFQGYISRASKSDTYKLDFDDNSGDYRTLCNNKNDEPSTTCTSSTSDMNMSVNGTTPSSLRKKTKGLVAVYVIIPVIIVIIIAVVGIIIWRRRSLQEKCLNSTHVTTTPPRQGPMNGGDGISNATYQEEFPAQTVIRSTGHEYLVLDPIGAGYAAIGDIEPEDSEYDTTGKVIQSMHNNEENNIYNRLNDGVDQIYDHTGVGQNHDDSDCNYSNSRSSIYNTPDTTNENRNVLNRRSRDDTDNDTYNHAISINNSQGDNETCKKDNAYNHIGSETRHLEYTDSDPTYDHTLKTTHGGKIGHSEKYEAVRTIDTVVAKQIGNAKPIYDYAQVNTDYKKKDSKPGMFTIENKQESENYEFAKEPPSSADYEIAKPPTN